MSADSVKARVCLSSGVPELSPALRPTATPSEIEDRYPKGLAKGTKLIVRGIQRHVIDAEMATGSSEDIGNRVFIPRMSLSPSESRLPFEMRRHQFPIRPAFAMTINKAQGQTMKQIGLYLPEHVFSHGQRSLLEVALSRVGSPTHITIVA